MKKISSLDTILKIANSYTPQKKCVPLAYFGKLRFQACHVKNVELLKKARNPSYKMNIDVGNKEQKITCGQFVNNYPDPDSLLHKQILTITNFPPRRIAGVKSQALTLGFPDSPKSHQAICLSIEEPIPSGAFVNFFGPTFQEDVDFKILLALEIKSGVIEYIKRSGNILIACVDLGKEIGKRAVWIPGNLENLDRYKGCHVPVFLNPIPFTIGEQFKVERLLFVVPTTSNKSSIYLPTYNETYLSKQHKVNVALVCVDKKVEKGCSIF